MTQEKRFSDEFLNAFVDDQLAAEEKGRAYLEIGQDEVLNRQVCELRKLHDLVKLAYREVPAPPVRANPPRQRGLRFGVAASLLLALGVVIGTRIDPRPAPVHVAADPAPAATPSPAMARHPRPATRRDASRDRLPVHLPVPQVRERPAETAVATLAVAPPSPVALPIAAPPASDAAGLEPRNKVLIHVAHDNVAQLGQALDEIEGLLRFYRDSGQSARVEVVINGRGLELVRVDTSAYAERIRGLQREYDNLTFAACQNTIDRLRREQGIIVRLLPGVVTIDSGMAEISRRQHQGWTYLQV